MDSFRLSAVSLQPKATAEKSIASSVEDFRL
jgi:hypothetical protein